jgi:hypothetical protein
MHRVACRDSNVTILSHARSSDPSLAFLVVADHIELDVK